MLRKKFVSVVSQETFYVVGDENGLACENVLEQRVSCVRVHLAVTEQQQQVEGLELEPGGIEDEQE
jgi:hypothetical protein